MSVDVLDSLRIVVRNDRDLGFAKLEAAGEMFSVNLEDFRILRNAAWRAADEIAKLRAENGRYSATIDRAMQTLDMATGGIEQLKRHRDDLQEANNRYLERARAAEAEIKRRDEKTEDAKQRVQQIMRDKVTSSSDLAEAIANLGKFIDMIEARAMAVDGPITPFCEELHSASAAEKERFQTILSKLYQFRNALATKPLISPEMVERLKKPLVTPEWVQEKAALEDGLDPTTGAATAEDVEVDVSFTRYMDRAYEAMGRAFKVLGLPKPSMFISACKISEITHSFDSLDFIEMLIEVEKTSGFLIDETELPGANLCNIGDIALVLAEKMAKAEGKTKAAGRIKQLAEKIALGGRS